MLKSNRRVLALTASLVAFCSPLGLAATLLEFDAAVAGFDNEPDELSPAWTRSGFPMFNSGSFLLQDTTFVASNDAGEYYSPAPVDGGIPAGTFLRGGAPYGIEFKIRPLNDVAFIGSAWPELYLSWADDQFHYNVTVDQFGGANTSGTGDVVYGQGSFSPAITGIDWSTPHSIFIGHRGSGVSSVFDFYLDGVIKSTIVDGSIARSRVGWEFLQDRISFGDGTTGGGGSSDVAAEWYNIRVTDTNQPVVPPSEWTVNADGNWSNASNWSNGVPNSLVGSGTARFGTAISAPRTVTLDAAQTIGHVVFDSPHRYSIAGTSVLTFSVAGNASIEVAQGSHTISAPARNTSPLIVNVAAGAELLMTSASNETGPNATFTKTGDGNLQLASLRGHRLTVDSGTVQLANSGGPFQTKFLNVIPGTAKLDVTNNFYSVDYDTGASPLADITAWLTTGRNGGAWNGPGIGSSLANANGRAVGVAEQSDLGVLTWGGVSVDSTAVLIRWTLIGDANLDGAVGFDDLLRLAQNYDSGPNKTWTQGDGNYDGVVNFDDLLALAQNYSLSVLDSAEASPDTQQFAHDWILARSLIPEPTAFAAMLGATCLVRRRAR